MLPIEYYQTTHNHSDLLSQLSSCSDPVNLLINNPKIIGLDLQNDGSLIFSKEKLKETVSLLKEHPKLDECMITLIKIHSNIDRTLIIEVLIELEMWSSIIKILQNLSYEELESLKSITNIELYLKNLPLEHITSLITAFPKLNWVKALHQNYPVYFTSGNTSMRFAPYIAHHAENDENHPLHIYTYIKSRNNPHILWRASSKIKQDIYQLFDSIFLAFTSPIYKNMPLEIKNTLIECVVTEHYPILRNCPEIFEFWNSCVKEGSRDCNKKIALLALNTYRVNNNRSYGYCKEAKIWAVEKVTDYLSKTPIATDPTLWRAFVQEIGKKQNVSKPTLKLIDIQNTISNILSPKLPEASSQCVLF